MTTIQNISCTIIKNGRTDAYGIALIAGNTYVLDFNFAKSLVSSGYATIANINLYDEGSTSTNFKLLEINALQLANLNLTYSASNPPPDKSIIYKVSDVNYSWNGTTYAAVGSGGGSSTVAPTVVNANRNLSNADNGLTLDCSGAFTLTIPTGLLAGFSCVIIPPDSANVSIASAGGVLLNGATATLARSATNIVFSIIARSTANSYKVTGI